MTTTTAPAAIRTEVEAFADAFVLLLAHYLVLPATVKRACTVLGITMADLDNARMRYQLGRIQPAGQRPLLPNVPPADEACKPNNQHRANAAGDPDSEGQSKTPRNKGDECDPVGAATAKPVRTAGSPSQPAPANGSAWTAPNTEPTSSSTPPAPTDPEEDEWQPTYPATAAGTRPNGPTSSRPSAHSVPDAAPHLFSPTRPTPQPGAPSPAVTEPERFCTTCANWLSPDSFAPNRKTCRNCRARRQRNYAANRDEFFEKATLRYRASALRCVECGGLITPGATVVGELRHVECA